MLEELLAIDLLLITTLLAHISYHCFQFQKERPQILESLNGKTTELFDILTEGGNLLADIGDLLDQEVPSSPVQKTGGGHPVEAILGLLMNRATMPNHGESKENRPIHQEEQSETSE